MSRASHFEVSLFSFLKQLERHNNRDWFADNKHRYQRDVRDPLLRFITDAAEPLQTISEQIIADHGDSQRHHGELKALEEDHWFARAARQLQHRR